MAQARHVFDKTRIRAKISLPDFFSSKEEPGAIVMAIPGSLSTAKMPRIILLEDERTLAQLFDFLIHEWFRKVALLKFESGDRAWQELSRHKPDLLIVDLGQPGVDGRKMLNRLAEVHASFPILLTAETFSDHLRVFVDHGLKLGFLLKPFGIQQFWDALNQLVGPSDIPERKTRLKNVFEFRH